jgi:hypothetical protein
MMDEFKIGNVKYDESIALGNYSKAISELHLK